MKLLIWMNMPSHHQAGFFAALVARGIDLQVCYYADVDAQRLSLGWAQHSLQPYEQRLLDLSQLPEQVTDWRERIHIVPGIAEPFGRQLILLLIKNKLKWVHWSEGFRFRLRSLISFPLQWVYTRFMVNRYALGVLANGSHARKQFSAWGVAPHRLALLPYSIASLPAHSEIGQDIQFLFLGSIETRKGVDTLLQAFSLLPSVQGLQLKIVGRVATGKKEPDLAFYQAIVTSPEKQKNIQFLPAIKVDQIAETISACDVLILPSRFDGFGVVVSEAAGLGKFIISSDQVGAAETLIDQAINGYIFKAEDAHALAECMNASSKIARSARRSAYSRDCFARAEAHHSAERLHLILESFLNFV